MEDKLEIIIKQNIINCYLLEAIILQSGISEKNLKKLMKDASKEANRCYQETVGKLLDKKDKVIDMMAEYIEGYTGSCPNDMYDWQDIDCEKECEISMKKCWIEYFYKLVEGNIDKK
jgi:hypothetical protein